MRSRFKLNAIIVSIAAVAALTLTVVRRTPNGVVTFTIEPAEVRAAPGDKQSKKDYKLSELVIFNKTLLYIKANYVDSSRIDPEAMLFEALDSVQFNIPEVLIESFPDRDELIVAVNDKQETFATGDVNSPWRLGKKLAQVFRFIEKNMNAGAELAEVEYAAVNGMLATLDPHSNLMDPESAREMDVSTSGKFGGLGIVIRMIDKKLTVVRPMKDTPASKKGIEPGDHIVKIDAEKTENLTLNEAVDRMRGDPGTPVTLYIERKGESKLLKVDLVRDVIRVESVVSKLLDKDVGYIKIKQFSSSTGAEVEAALDTLGKKGAEGWVLDLRGNPGGLLEQAIAVTDLFVDAGTIVTTVSGKEREPRRAAKGNGDVSSPLVVLVSPGSASASEIVAGAIKNLDRGLIVGMRTFGKGSVQVLYDNDDGSKLKLTVAEYLTPGDRSIQSVGVVPDIALQRMYVPDKNDAIGDWVRLLPPSHQWGERDLDAAIVSQYARDNETPTYEVPFVYERPGKKTTDDTDAMPGEEEDPEELYEDLDEDEVIEDFEIKLGKDIVASLDDSTRTAMVKSVKTLVTKRRAEQETKLIAALDKLGVDWSEAPSKQDEAPALTATMSVSPSNELQAGDDVTITGSVTNSGAGPAWRVHARIAAADSVFDDTELVFGKVGPGETKTFSARLRVPKDAIDRVEALTFAITEGRGQAVVAAPLELRIKAAARPTYAYAYQLVDDGNGDGLVQMAERHVLRVTIKNAGDGVSAETTAVLRNASGDGISLDKSRFEVGKLAPGDSEVIDYAFEVTDKLEGDAAHVELMIWDNVLGVTATEKLKFPVEKAVKVESASGTVDVKKKTELRQGASDDAPVVGWAKKDAKFKSLGTAGNWTKIEVESGRTAFLPTSKVSKASGSASGGFDLLWQVTPPEITLTSPVYETTGSTYDLSGKVTDESHVEDVYIYVSNAGAKIDGRKVFYSSNRGSKTEDAMSFTAELPLWPGSNHVTVVARESVNVRAVQSFYIYRDQSKTASVK